MNIEKRIKDELLDAAKNSTEGAEAFVMAIGHEDKGAAINMIGPAGSILSLLCKALDRALELCPDELEKELRVKVAMVILGGTDDDAE